MSHEELVKRLREFGELETWPSAPPWRTMRDAATTIEAQAARIAELEFDAKVRRNIADHAPALNRLAWHEGYEAAREQAAAHADRFLENYGMNKHARDVLANAIRAMTPTPDERQETPAPRTDTEPR